MGEDAQVNWTEEQYTEYIHKRAGGVILTPVKKQKYNNNRIKVDGILFDSQKEADYYSDLKMQLRAGVIKGFCRQPEFILQEGIGETKPITYKGDFIIWHLDGTSEIIDVKGFCTEVYKIKKKMFKAKFPGLELREVEG